VSGASRRAAKVSPECPGNSTFSVFILNSPSVTGFANLAAFAASQRPDHFASASFNMSQADVIHHNR
jgi:hypothetical protein